MFLQPEYDCVLTTFLCARIYICLAFMRHIRWFQVPLKKPQNINYSKGREKVKYGTIEKKNLNAWVGWLAKTEIATTDQSD